MSNELDQPSESPEPAQASGHVLGPRKRIVAREVQSAALAPFHPAELSELATSIETPPPTLRVRPEPLVLDPTARIGERHRRHDHQLGYRLTAGVTALGFVAACAGIALLLMDRLTLARLISVAGLVAALGSVHLSRTSPLAARLRGYAIATTVLAALSLAANLAGNLVHQALNETKTTVSKPAPH